MGTNIIAIKQNREINEMPIKMINSFNICIEYQNHLNPINVNITRNVRIEMQESPIFNKLI